MRSTSFYSQLVHPYGQKTTQCTLHLRNIQINMYISGHYYRGSDQFDINRVKQMYYTHLVYAEKRRGDF